MREIIKKFSDNDSKFAYKAVEEARKNKDKISDILLSEIDNIGNNIGIIDYYVPISFDYFVFLLAEFRDERLFGKLIKILSKKDVDYWDIIGSGVMDSLADIVVSVFNGDYDSLNKIIENKEIDSFVREKFLICYIYFYEQDMIDKDELIDYLRKLIRLYIDEVDDIFNAILDVILSTRLFEMMRDVRNLYDIGLIDFGMNGGYDDFIDYIFNYEYRSNDVRPVKSIVDEMAWWHCFQSKNNKEDDNLDKIVDSFSDFAKRNMQINLVNPYKDIGRNDPCPCGSGKKYKKCCIDKDKQEQSNILPYQKYIISSLKDYPKRKLNKEQLDIYDFYKGEYIEIDKLLYKVLKHRCIPMWINRNYKKEAEIDLNTLDEVYVLIKGIIKKEEISSVYEYNDKIGIHYGLYDFFCRYCRLLFEQINDGINIDLNKNKIKELIKWVSDNLELDDDMRDLVAQVKIELKKNIRRI